MVLGLGIFEGKKGKKRREEVRRGLEKKGLRTPEAEKESGKKQKKKTRKRKKDVRSDIAFIKSELGITRSLKPDKLKPFEFRKL